VAPVEPVAPGVAPVAAAEVRSPPRASKASAGWPLALPALAVVAALLAATLGPPLLPLLHLVAPPTAVDQGTPSARAVFDPRWLRALGIQLLFTASVLAVELPLGSALARALPRRGIAAALAVVVLAYPLVLPHSLHELLRTELFPRAVASIEPLAAVLPPAAVEYLGYVVVDAWRFTPLVALLCAVALHRWHASARAAIAIAAAVRVAGTFAAWPDLGSPVSLAAWVGGQMADAAGPAAALSLGLTLLLLLFLPRPRR
jgi:hypothetical protein